MIVHMICHSNTAKTCNTPVLLSIDSEGYTHKPCGEEPRKISNILRGYKAHTSHKALNIEQIAELIQSGHTHQGAQVSDKKDKDDTNTDLRFLKQQIFFIDIDNVAKDGTKLPQSIDTPEQILEICKKANIMPCIIYESFSSGKKDPNGNIINKYHVLFAVDKPITDVLQARRIILGLLHLFGNDTADKSCKDPARIFYATAKDKKVYVCSAVNSAELLLSLYTPEEPAPAEPIPATAPERAEEQAQRDFEKAFKSTEADPDRLLMMIDPNNLEYEEWRRVSASYKFSEGASLDFWLMWDRQYEKVNEKADIRTYKGLTGKGITKGTLKYFAKKHSPAEWDKYIEELKPRRGRPRTASKDPHPERGTQSGTASVVELIPLELPFKRPENYVDFAFKNSSNKIIIIPQLLAENVRKTCKYIFVKGSDPAEQVRRFWYDNGVYTPIADEFIKDVLRSKIQPFGISLCKKTYIEEAFYQLSIDNVFHADTELNADENIINFKNGLLHLDTMQITKHTPDILSTIQIPCNYVPGKTLNDAPVFNSFISRLANYDEDSKKTLIEYIGVSISNVDGGTYKKALFLKGNGNCGKSQYIKLITHLLSDRYCATSSLDNLEKRFGAYTLYNKRFVADPDTKYIKLAELNVFKKATGGDHIDMEPKGKNTFKAPYKGLLCFGCNSLPLFGGDHGEWVYNRILPIECGPSVTDQERDPKLLDKLKNECESIVSIAIVALKETIANKYCFTFSQSSKKLLEQYKIENDVVRQFINECCEIRTEKTTKDGINQKILFNAFLEWIKQSNIKHAASKKEFNKSLLEIAGTPNQKDIEYKLHGGIRYYVWTLTQEAKQELHAFDSTPK